MRDEQRRIETPASRRRSNAPAEPPLRVLFVCTANICRSPYMELRARTLVNDAGAGASLELASAGTHGFHLNPMDATMASVLLERGVRERSVQAFRSRRITSDLVETADLVLTAEASHRSFVLDEAPSSFRKVFTLGQFAESAARVPEDVSGIDLVTAVGHRRSGTSESHDVGDPYNRGREAAERAADQIDDLLRVVLPRLTASRKIAP